MTPTIVLDERGRPWLVTGARGGPRIITATFQVLSNILDHDMGLAAAVSAPRIHHQHLPDVLFYEEGGLPPDAVDALRALGHAARCGSAWAASASVLSRRRARDPAPVALRRGTCALAATPAAAGRPRRVLVEL